MSKALATKNVAAVLVAVALVFGFAFSFAAPAKADMLSDLQAQVQALLAQIASLQGGSSSVSTGAGCTTFTQNLKPGSTGGEVMAVQKFLNSNGFQVAASGAGSPGNETSTFGPATKAAVIKFQNAHAADILTPVGLTTGTGNWFASTRAKANAMCVGGGTTVTPPSSIPTTGGSLMVGAASQPANSLAPKGTSRVPFTTLTLTNNSGAAVTVNSVSVQRTGLGQDAAFAGIILVDEMGVQLGNSRTLNSNHQVNAGDPFVINPGQTKTITVMGNMASSLADYAGQVVSLSVIGVNTNGTVSGVLPINGASHTLNNTLTIGTLAAAVGSSDLDSAQTNQSIGETGKVGAGVRLTAGSAEDVWVKSIRFNQSGSASQSDIANVVAMIDGTSYPMTVSADGKYYWATFPGNGIQIMKGLQKEVIVKFDIVSGPNRTVQFDLYKNTDIYAVGGTYGYGISVTQSENGTASTGSEFINGTPFFSGSQFTISAGTATSYSRASEVAADNIAIASPNQTLGGFAFDVKGEAIQVQSHVFKFNYTNSSSDNGELLTSVRMVDKNGVVVAGPVDATLVGGNEQKVTFTDLVSYPVGRNVYTLQGQLPSTISNGQTIIASTTPSADWSNITGASTGDAISLSALSSAVSGNTMTVRSGAVVASVNAEPAARTIVAGLAGQLVGQIDLNATQSGEDVRFTSIKIYYTDSMTNDPTNCFVYDGTTRLNDNAVNPATSGDDTYTLNQNVTVKKGERKTLGVKCDIPASASSGTFSFGVNDDGSGNATFTGTGAASSQSITPTTATGALAAGNTMTMSGAGTLTVALDASSPSYSIAAGGATGVTLGVLRFSGTNEDMRLDRVALQLSDVASTSIPGSVTIVKLYDGATQVGTAVFSGTRFATTTFISTDYDNDGFAGVKVGANNYKIITLKGDLGAIGTGQAGMQGALVKVDFDNDDSTGTRAVGASSGNTINRTSSADTAVAGVRTFRSYPTVAKLTPPTTTLVAQAGTELYRFSVTANATGDVGIHQFVVNIATSSFTSANGATQVDNLKIYAFTDSAMSQGVSGFVSGLVSNTATDIAVTSGDIEMAIDQSSMDKLQIPAGATYYFRVTGDVTQEAGSSGSAGSVTTKLSGDAAYPVTIPTVLGPAASVDTDANDDFIWSGNQATTSGAQAQDWTNGYGVVGLPAGGTDATTLTK